MDFKLKVGEIRRMIIKKINEWALKNPNNYEFFSICCMFFTILIVEIIWYLS